jgi:hypothetical protein
VQPRVQTILNQVRTPIMASTGKAKIELQVGVLNVAPSGILANIDSGANPKQLPITDATLASLPQDRPVLLGGLELIEAVVGTELASREDYFTMDLQTVAGFRKLMKSRLAQFFVWKDLMNYPKTNPFYLRIQNPRTVTLTQDGTTGVLKTTVGINGVIQSYRGETWWNYVLIGGKVDASIKVSLNDGVMSYGTTLKEPVVTMNYGAEYLSRYGKASKIPKSRLTSGLAGQPENLKGSLKFDDISLDGVGKYRASSIKWLAPKLFAIPWTQLN